MADIGRPEREITIDPIRVPQREPGEIPAPAEPVTVPEREPVPA